MFTMVRRLLFIISAIIFAEGHILAQQGTPHPDDGFWDYRFGHPGLGGTITGMAAANGKLYLVGGFGLTFKNGGQPYAVAVWDGTGWTFDGAMTIPGLSGDFILPGVTGFIIAGNFTNLDNRKINYLASWNGTKWDSLGPQLNGRVRTLYNGAEGLYAGGEFSKFGDSTANRIAVWDGTKWKKMIDAGTANGVNSTVYSITGSASFLYFGGSFTTAGGLTGVNRVAQWNWTTKQWSKLGKGFDNDVFAIVNNLGTVTAGGWFGHAGDGTDSTQNVSEFNGTKWVDIGDGISSYPQSNNMYSPSTGGVFISGTYYYAPGLSHGVMYRSGSTWSALGDVQTASGITGEGSTIYAGASLSEDGTKDYRGTGKWDGTSWKGLGNPIGVYYEFPSANYVGTLGYANGTVYAAGTFSSASDIRKAGLNFVMFQGGKWNEVGGTIKFGTSPGYVNGMATIGTDLYAAGLFTAIGATTLKNIGRWNGSAWSPLGNGTNGTINAVAAGNSGLYITGTFDSAGTQRVNGIAKWDGSSWTRLGGGIGISGAARTIAVNGNDVVVAGFNIGIIDSGRVSINGGIAKWNGTSWSAIPPLPDKASTTHQPTTALAFIGNDLYVAANYYSGQYLGFVYKWNGTEWSQIGGQIGKAVSGLWANGTDLYVTGNFKTIGTDTIWNIAKWNGSAWTPLGTGLISAYNGGDEGRVLVGSPEGLFVGGTFSQAGKYSSNNIALWKNYTPKSPAQSLNAPVQSTPANKSTGQPTNCNVAWAAVTGATGYQIQVSTDSTFATTLVNDSTLTGATRLLSSLAINTKYFWRVRSKNASSTSWWSEVWNFRTGTSPSGVGQISSIPSEFALHQNFPNPFNPTTQLRFTIAELRFVQLKVYDVLGREIATLVNEQKNPGTYAVEWNAAGLSSGIYFYRLEAGTFVDAKKMLLLK